ncbi:MAG: hypothetical protein N4A35_12240 [Flavobacteriales bacterium]|jgi:hypothetical protein|nr:hypothetical protein [Flavobacteriales bacterium]
MKSFWSGNLKKGNGWLIFSIFLVIHLLPLFATDFLLTLDGPSHLYNAKIFNELLGGNPFLSEYYQINTELVPNYLGHLILSFFLLLMSPILALKLIHLLYVVGIAIAFRKLVLIINPASGKLSVLIFPLIYSAPFISGFYNFSLALILLLWTLYFWFKNKENRPLMFYLKLGALMLLTYFAHSFTFAVLCLSIGVIVVGEKGIKNVKEWLVDGGKVLIAAIVPIGLALSFVMSRATIPTYLTGEQLWEQLQDFKFIFSYHNETSHGVFIYVLLSLLGSVLFKEKKALSLLYIALILLGLYFYLPDGVGYASVFSIRTLLLSFLFFILWLALQKRNRIIQAILIGVLFFYQQHRMSELKEWMAVKNNKAKEMLKVGELIPQHSTILPVRTLNTWQYFHLSNLLGVNKPQLILENYEAAHDYFPIKWKDNLEQQIKENRERIEAIDYIIKIGYAAPESSAEKDFVHYADSLGVKVYQSDFVVLYQLNKLR